MPEKKRLICVRVADMPVPHTRAFEAKCCQCQQPVWVAYSSPSAPPLCVQCAYPVLLDPKTTFGDVTEAQIADAKAILRRKPI